MRCLVRFVFISIVISYNLQSSFLFLNNNYTLFESLQEEEAEEEEDEETIARKKEEEAKRKAEEEEAQRKAEELPPEMPPPPPSPSPSEPEVPVNNKLWNVLGYFCYKYTGLQKHNENKKKMCQNHVAFHMLGYSFNIGNRNSLIGCQNL